MRLRNTTVSPEVGEGGQLWRFVFFIGLRALLSFQADTVCTQKQEPACGSNPVEVSAAVPRGPEREEGLKPVT